MVFYSLFSLVCIAIMVTLVLCLAGKYLRLNRAGRIDFIKSFKKGKGAIIYLVAIPLYFMGNLYLNLSVENAFFDSISKSLNLVILNFNFMNDLMAANRFYHDACYICFYLVVLNASMITLSILHQSIWGMFRSAQFRTFCGEKCIIIGNNEKSRMIYDSCHCRKIIVGVIPKNEIEELYKKGITYKSFGKDFRLMEWLTREIKNKIKKYAGSKKKINVIINNDDEHLNLDWCGEFVKLIQELDPAYLHNIDVYVFGDRDYEDIYSKYEEKALGNLHYLNEYQQLAIDFIDRYPLTEFMDARHIDYQTSLINPDVEINVSMRGFGRTNQQIFLSMVANNQLLTKDENGKIVVKKVNYHFFDKSYESDAKNLKHNYFRYKRSFFRDGTPAVDPSRYLDLPEVPSTEQYHYSDDLEKTISFDPRAINYIIVSLGVDYDSIDMTNKIVTQLKEWKLENTHVFVRIRDKKTFKDSDLFLDLKYCHPFGTDEDVVYDYSHIIQEKFTEMAIMRNLIYDMEYEMKGRQVTEAEKTQSRMNWFMKRCAVERELNVYSCLSLRNKLQLMKLDYCKKDASDEPGLSEEEYFKIYTQNDSPDAHPNYESVKEMRDEPGSRRKVMAIQEHERWNAYMIMKGFVPATRDEILNETNSEGKHTNGENYEMRHHGNLTTFEGRVEFRKMLAKRDACPESKYDRIKYDYQILDEAWRLLDQNGYKIVPCKVSEKAFAPRKEI